MTDERMNFRGLLEKSPDADLLREMIDFAAQRLMALEVGGLTNAGFTPPSETRPPSDCSSISKMIPLGFSPS